jgi:hypothetical protein
MAAIVDATNVLGDKELNAFNDQLKTRLPAYARPIFLRLCNEVDKTGLCLFKNKLSFTYFL